jgi:peptide chain release factor subunit 1
MISKHAFKNSIINYTKNQELKEKLEEIHNSKLLPVKIASIEIKKEKVPMIDISVTNESFISNGLIVHNSAQRFARIREGAAKDHFKKIAEHMKEQFLHFGNNLKGIIIGGPVITINDFMNKDYITGDLKRKIIGTKDLSYTGDFGLQELLDKSEDLLAEEEIATEKKSMAQFFEVFRDHPKKITYGDAETNKALDMNAVGILLLSESLAEEIIDALTEKAELSSAEVKLISIETREGQQLKDLGGIAAILRYEI